MAQFKDKSIKNKNFTTGLLTYPILMAADILAMDTNYVPVGIDQKQHVELTRDIAIRFNKKYGETFVVPEPIITESGTKIMDLVTPDKKMSKSSVNKKGVIRILDSEEDIRKKIMSATTDSESCVKFNPDTKPGISNLINIYSSLSDLTVDEVEKKFKNSNYGNFKKKTADLVVKELTKIQKKYKEIINSSYLDEILDKGASESRKFAKEKYEIMKEKVGLGR